MVIVPLHDEKTFEDPCAKPEDFAMLVERYGFPGGTSTQMLDTFYGFSINTGGKSIAAVIIDPQGWLADVDKDNDQVIVD